MLRIRSEQLYALTSVLVEKLADRIFGEVMSEPLIAQQYGDATLLKDRIAELIEHNRQLSFRHDSSVIEYVKVCLRYRSDIYKSTLNDDTVRLLEKRNLDESEKLYLIQSMLDSA